MPRVRVPSRLGGRSGGEVGTTYISLILEVCAPLHHMMDQVGHEDSRTTLEIYAHVQKRVSRPQVKRAFEELLARTDVGELGVPAEAREKMSPQPPNGRSKPPGGPPDYRVVHTRTIDPPRMTSTSLITRDKPRISRAFPNGHGWFRTTDLSRVKRYCNGMN